MHPILKPGLRRLWHNGSTLQLGIDPVRAVVVTGLQPTHTALLAALDGRRTWDQVRADGGPAGQDLLDLFAEAGLLADADLSALSAPDPQSAARLAEALGVPGRAVEPAEAAVTAAARGRLAPDLAALSLRWADPARPLAVLRARQAARVLVRGAGRVGAQIAALLGAAGIGRVVIDDPGVTSAADVAPGGLQLADVGRSRALAAGGALARVGHAPTGRQAPPASAFTAPPSRPVGHDHAGADGRGSRAAVPPAFEADLVVLAPIGPPLLAPDLTLDLERRGHAHLLVGVRETSGIVGPLVVPTVTACLHCQHLHRHDRDPAWPLLALQLIRPRPAGDDPCDVILASLVAALAAMQALDYIDAIAAAPRSGPVDGRPPALQPESESSESETKTVFSPADVPLPATADGSLEFAVPGWRVARRSWPTHPNCPCRTARSVARAAPAGAFPAGRIRPRPGGAGGTGGGATGGAGSALSHRGRPAKPG
ncbi:ThiF family adenylyltransferase [Frankia sp. R82]|uniref:ThiF family adenylyltransferase n=1 Tax=Frankia sp. R82 TaxID=2950553 RepID=UPI002043D597|nr:ThiF family adenylyltransferase [Frankia sp. R82]MCM3884657.1 ThiF family adenylyltransferase [Frankia sp. R82]